MNFIKILVFALISCLALVVSYSAIAMTRMVALLRRVSIGCSLRRRDVGPRRLTIYKPHRGIGVCDSMINDTTDDEACDRDDDAPSSSIGSCDDRRMSQQPNL